MLEERPLSFLMFATSAICGLSGLLLRVYERSEDSIRSLYDSLWLISYTQRTIGYGDVIPQTHFGRLICVGAGFVGCMTLSLMINFVEQSTRLTVREKDFLKELYCKEQARTHLPSLAVLLLQRWWRVVAARRDKRKRLQLLRLYNWTAASFRLRYQIMISKENPEVDETILKVQEDVGAQFAIYIAELQPLRRCGEKLANFSTCLSRFTVKLLEGRSQAKRLASILALEKREPLRVNRFTWTARAAQVSKIAKKRKTDKAYKRVRGIVISRDCSPISRSSLEVRESVSTTSQDV